MTLFISENIFYLHQSSGCYNYSVPRYLQQHVDLIKPTVHFDHRPAPNSLQKRTGSLGQPFLSTDPNMLSKPMVTLPTPSMKNCDKMITLDCLRSLYKIDYTPRSTDKNTFGIGNLRLHGPLPPNIYYVA